MQPPIGRLASAGFAVALTVLGANVWVSYRNTGDLQRNAEWLEHTHRVVWQCWTISSLQ